MPADNNSDYTISDGTEEQATVSGSTKIAEASGSAPVGPSSADTDTSSPEASLQYVTIESCPNGDVLLKRSGPGGGLKIGPGCRFRHFAQSTEANEDGIGFVRLRRINHLRDTLGLDQGDICSIKFWVEQDENDRARCFAEIEGVGGQRERVEADTVFNCLHTVAEKIDRPYKESMGMA